MRKVPKYIKVLQEKQRAMMQHVWEVIELKKQNHPQLLPCYQEKPIEYWIGLADGANSMFENALHLAKVYRGFSHVHFVRGTMALTSVRDVQDQNGNYQGWCRDYFVE